jgi:uncharacterized protein YndB with AHSA1/START domain
VTVEAKLETTIARGSSAVFAELAAVERFPEWLTASGIRSVEALDGVPVGEGSRLRIEQRIAGRSTTLDGVVTAFAPGERFALRATDAQGIAIELTAELAGDSATGSAATRVRWSIRMSLPLRFRFFESMVAPELRRAATTDLENLRRRLEAVAG